MCVCVCVCITISFIINVINRFRLLESESVRTYYKKQCKLYAQTIEYFSFHSKRCLHWYRSNMLPEKFSSTGIEKAHHLVVQV